MKQKSRVHWAVIIAVIFGLTVVAYPLIFGPADEAGQEEPTIDPNSAE